VVVTLDKIEGSSDNSHWTTLSAAKHTLDLVPLGNGNPATLLDAASTPAGDYAYVRITWGTTAATPSQGANYVVDNAANSWTLAMPTGNTTTLATAIQLPSDQTVTAQLNLGGVHAIQPRVPASGTPSYVFQPAGSGYNLGNCATLTGHLTGNGAALSGVEVYAESLDGNLEPSILRSTLTDGNGRYVLDGLPAANATYYYVVAQPAGTSASYAAGSLTVAAFSNAIYANNDLAYGNPLTPGSMAATVSPASTSAQATWVQLRQSLGNVTLIVRSLPVATGAATDSASFAGLYPGTYGVAAQRSTSGAAPVKQAASSAAVVTSGNATPSTITYN
jgi:hypothetical protein